MYPKDSSPCSAGGAGEFPLGQDCATGVGSQMRSGLCSESAGFVAGVNLNRARPFARKIFRNAPALCEQA